MGGRKRPRERRFRTHHPGWPSQRSVHVPATERLQPNLAAIGSRLRGLHHGDHIRKPFHQLAIPD